MPVGSLLHDRLVAAEARGWSELDWSALGRLAAFEAGIPESFNVLVKEMRSLGLNVELENS
jgi:DNA-directed RNA polymerase beta subunit